MQDRIVEQSKEPFLMSAILSSSPVNGVGPSTQAMETSRLVKRRRSEDSGGSSSEHRSISPMDLTSKTGGSSSRSESSSESPTEHRSAGNPHIHMHHNPASHEEDTNLKRRRLDDILHRKFPSSSVSGGETTPLSSRKRKLPTASEDEEENASLRAGRLIQIAALMNSEVFKNNPLLYYGYYAQLIQSLQRPTQEEEEHTRDKSKIRKVNINNNTPESSTPFRDYTSPEATVKKCSFSLSSLLSTPSSPSSATSSPAASRAVPDITPPSSLLADPASPGSSPDEEPRHKRAPRALTGRYVRPGTGASPRTLALLRHKIQERLRARGEETQQTTVIHPVPRKAIKKPIKKAC